MFDFLHDLFDFHEHADHSAGDHIDVVEHPHDHALDVEHLHHIHEKLNIPVDHNLDWVMNTSDDIKVLYALDRMTNHIEHLNTDEIDHFLHDHSYSATAWAGVVNNWKGIYGEIKVLDELQEHHDGLHYVIPESTTNPGVDIYALNDKGEICEMFQVKMTSDHSYIEHTLNQLPENIKIICPSDVAKEFDDPRIIDAGFTHAELLEDISDVTEIVMGHEEWETLLDQDGQFNSWLENSFTYNS